MGVAEANAGLTIYTIGHSNHSLARFIGLLHQHRIEVVADVRSAPYSAHATWFNGSELKSSLPSSGIRYLFLGDLVGGRPDSSKFYDEERRVRYDLLSQSQPFREGTEQLLGGAAARRIAIMCGEENPSECHRNLLIGRVLADRGVEVLHIGGDGRIERDTEPPELTLFGDQGESEWRSTRSVSPRSRHRSSSDS